MDDRALLEAAADNLAGWHRCSIEALGFPTATGPQWWTSPTPGPWIYFTAILRRSPRGRPEIDAALDALRLHLDDPAGSYEAVCDSFGVLDLEPLGLTRRMSGLWYARPAGPAPREADPDDLVITEVRDADDLEAFEVATCAAFGAPPPLTPFEIHARAVLDDPAMHVLIGRVGTTIVSGAMAYEGAGVLGIYGVGTVPGHRGQGHASALTRACLAIEPMRPAILQPSPEATALYRRLGFTEVGRFLHWG
ncbi:MAG TPA: GNAT family N-acetyltransferase [Acidimicrobiales bacterium]